MEDQRNSSSSKKHLMTPQIRLFPRPLYSYPNPVQSWPHTINLTLSYLCLFALVRVCGCLTLRVSPVADRQPVQDVLRLSLEDSWDKLQPPSVAIKPLCQRCVDTCYFKIDLLWKREVSNTAENQLRDMNDVLWGPLIKVNKPLKHYFIYLFYFLHYFGPFFVFFVCLLQFLSLKIHKTDELNWWQNRWFSHRGRIQLPLWVIAADVSQALTTVLQGGSDPSYSQTRLYLDWLGTHFYTLK